MPTRSSKTTRSTATPVAMRGEFRTGPVAGTALVSGVTFDRKGLQYAEVDGLAIFEGDIVLGPVEEVRAAAASDAGSLPQFSIGITGQQFRWPNATVPYDIDPALTNQQRVTDAIAHWQANTRIRFVLRTAANASQHNDFVRFQPGNGCTSMVGRRGGRQNITLGAGCPLGSVIHEIGHAVGLWHEQSRQDRDTFVRIVWENIDPSMQHNFAQHITDGDDLGPYDYGSIMHYPPNAFSINMQPTIVPLQPLPPDVVLGQRNGLSQGDINGVRMLYPAPTFKEVAKDPILDTLKEIAKDSIQDVLKKAGKDPVWDTFKEAGKDPITDTLKEIAKDLIIDSLIKPVGDGLGGTLVEAVTQPVPLPGLEGGVAPYVLASPSRAGNVGPVETNTQAQELLATLALIEQQHTQLRQAYEAAVQALEALQKG